MYFYSYLTVFASMIACISSAAISKPEHNHISKLEARGIPKFFGDGTYYWTQTGNKGSCGSYLNDDDFIVALNAPQMKGGVECGREVWVTNLINGETRVARIMDTCPECQFGSLDMSPSLFKSMCFDNLGFGRVGIMWGFCDREHGC